MLDLWYSSRDGAQDQWGTESHKHGGLDCDKAPTGLPKIYWVYEGSLIAWQILH